MNKIPDISGMKVLSRKTKTVVGINPKQVPLSVVSLPKKSNYVEDVDLLITDYSDKAFMYKDGKVDIIKNGVQKTVTFPNKKDAVLYLMKTGWKYV